MKQFSIKLRKILLFDTLYYIFLLISLIYLIIYINNYNYKCDIDVSQNTFALKIKDFKIDGNKLSIDFDSLIGVYYFKTEKEKNSFNYNINDEVTVEGYLEIPPNNTIPNMFNYNQYLKHNNKCYILHINKINILNKNKNILYIIKNYIIKRINNISYNQYLYAFILGKSSYLDKETYSNYRINGVTHLFALSGLHVSMFSSILLKIFKKIKFNEKISYLFTSVFLVFFSFIASFTPSILRATIFFILSSLNQIHYLFIKPKYLLFLTFILMIIINPLFVYNNGFILSFVITYFILLYNENYTKSNILKISIISMLSSLPIIINMSYEINIVGFINNIFFIPYVSNIVFPLSLLTLFLEKLNVLLQILINIMEKISFYSTKIFNLCLYFGKLSSIEIAIYYFILILIIKYKNKTLYLSLVLILFYFYFKQNFNKSDYIYFLDVNQGDSSLIITKNKNSILIDTGGMVSNKVNNWEKKNNEFNIMKSSLIPFFKSIGTKKVNYLIITHGDFDHMGEAINLVNNFKVEKVIFNCGEFNDLEQKLIKVLDKKKIKYYSCIKELDIDKNKLYFLQTKEYDNENDNSNVIYTELNNYKFMFMGDASVTTEKEILDKYNLSDIDVLKVGHHGSRTSSSKEFINEINPKYTIISVGKNNRYGHPNKEVLDNLKDTKIYRTDEDGSIMFKIKNNKLKIETCTP